MCNFSVVRPASSRQGYPLPVCVYHGGVWFRACFWTETLEKGMVINLNLNCRTGIAAKDWDSIAKKEKIDVSTVPAIDLGHGNSGPVCFSAWIVAEGCTSYEQAFLTNACFSSRQFRLKQTGPLVTFPPARISCLAIAFLAWRFSYCMRILVLAGNELHVHTSNCLCVALLL